nr:MAG TPA: hypothetical protein [Caudoviricetes sp.]
MGLVPFTIISFVVENLRAENISSNQPNHVSVQ